MTSGRRKTRYGKPTISTSLDLRSQFPALPTDLATGWEGYLRHFLEKRDQEPAEWSIDCQKNRWVIQGCRSCTLLLSWKDDFSGTVKPDRSNWADQDELTKIAAEVMALLTVHALTDLEFEKYSQKTEGPDLVLSDDVYVEVSGTRGGGLEDRVRRKLNRVNEYYPKLTVLIFVASFGDFRAWFNESTFKKI